MSVLGTSVRRADGVAKVTGQAVYGIDYEEAHLLHGRLLRSWLPAARVVSVDIGPALELPGVRAVLTAADAPHLSGFAIKDQPLFAGDVVRYAGEPLAAVAADTWEQARLAAAAIRVELEAIEPIVTIEQALSPQARLVHADWASYGMNFPGPRDGNVAWESTLNRGDVDAAFARDDVVVVEGRYESERQHQAYIEPRVAVARYEAGRYVIHSSCQWPFNARNGTAEYLGVRPSDVRFVVTTIGGGFGGKLVPTVEPYAALLAKKSGRPVKMVNTRREEFVAGNPRENGEVRIRSAATRDGDIVAQESLVLMDNGAYSGEMPLCAGIHAMVLPSTYRVGAIRHAARVVYTNTCPTGAFRGVSGCYAHWAMERHMDEIAAAIGLDRRELRHRNALRSGDHGPTSQPLPNVGLEEAFRRVEEVAPWAEAQARSSRGRREGGPLRGVGTSALMWLTNPMPGAVTVKLNEDGSVGVMSAATDCGTGAMTTGVPQIVAEELGVRPEDVYVVQPDTDIAGYDAGSQGSRTTYAIGNAAVRASAEVRQQVLDTAAGMLEASENDLELVDGHVRVKGSPDRMLPLAAVAMTALWTGGPITGKGKHIAPPLPFDAGCTVGSFFVTFSGATWHVHQAEVEVDPDTGRVRVTRYVVAQDVGKAINPAMIRGQIQGGVVQGLGYTLYEALRIGDDGRALDTTFESYRLPTALDAPAVEALIFELPDPDAPHGAKGVAEPPIVPVAAVIASAVSDAIGAPVDTLPITPDVVLAALRGRSTDGAPAAPAWGAEATEPSLALVSTRAVVAQ